MGKFEDLTNNKYGKLQVIKREKNKGKIPMWLCVCECGKECVIRGEYLRTGHTKSCGCMRSKNALSLFATHNKSNTRLYKIYRGMRQRCYNPKNKRYKEYGARGVTVCEEWLNNFEAFYEWAIANGYRDNLTIDREDANKNYEPSNCRWITAKEQANNKRNNNYITYNGETHTIAEWAEIYNIKYSTLYQRINRYGWSVDRALNAK